MTVEGWQVAAAFGSNLLAVWGLIQQANRAAAARTDKRFDEIGVQFADVERRLREAQEMKGEVRGYLQRFESGDRRMTELASRLDRLEGGLSEQIRSVQIETSALGKQVAELRGELNIGGMVRGIFGARRSDKGEEG